MKHRSHSLLAYWAAALVASACQTGAAKTDASRPALALPQRAPAHSVSDAAKLPEDPEAGARSLALWQQHLDREERERMLNYDRRKLAQHRKVVAILRGSRQAYDAAASAAAVQLAQQKLRSAQPGLEKTFESIDHWGANSKLLPEYRRLVELLSDSYPRAHVVGLTGAKVELERVRAETDQRFATIDAWLHEALESEDE